uniref:Uncharacterized protein n=1 Tax=Cacopsylla melanoneura TaxID=428564 RepID=A0A8D8VYV2_9HEMI
MPDTRVAGDVNLSLTRCSDVCPTATPHTACYLIFHGTCDNAIVIPVTRTIHNASSRLLTNPSRLCPVCSLLLFPSLFHPPHTSVAKSLFLLFTLAFSRIEASLFLSLDFSFVRFFSLSLLF